MQFKNVPSDLFAQVEPEAGEILRPNRRRKHTEFVPDWGYLATPQASAAAVTAGLAADEEVPDGILPRVLRAHCPTAVQLLAEHGLDVEQWHAGQAPADLTNLVAALANAELDGYAVFQVPDATELAAEVIGRLGAVPRFVAGDGQ